MSLKIRAKNFCPDECALLVDLVQENKQKLFGALSSSLTSEEKNIIWGDIAQQLSEAYRTERTKDDVAKKWSNILAKYKPIISDKMISVRKTGGGSPEANLSEMELKIKCIKGKELFEGVNLGIDLSLGSPISPFSPLSESEVSISNVSNIEPKQTKKRKFFAEDDTLGQSLKKILMEGEQEKLAILKSIDSKMDRIVNLLETVVGNQNKMISDSTTPLQSTIPPFQPAASTPIFPPPNPRGYYKPFMPPFHHNFPTND